MTIYSVSEDYSLSMEQGDSKERMIIFRKLLHKKLLNCFGGSMLNQESLLPLVIQLVYEHLHQCYRVVN